MRVKKIFKIAVGAGVLGMLLASGSQGQESSSSRAMNVVENIESVGKMLFKLADTNNDNRISQKEAIDAGNLLAGGFFFRADTNGDGTVTAAEAAAARESLFNQRPLLRTIFQRGKAEIDRQRQEQHAGAQQNLTLMNIIDSNHDRNISASELRQAVQNSVQSLFTMADSNGDGQLEPAELNQALADMGRATVQTAFNAADKDKNGVISQAEFDQALVNPAHVLFRILDANNDNQISQDEMRSGAQILANELRSMRVPEPGNSPSNQLRSLESSPVRGSSVAPHPAATAPVQPAWPAPGTTTIAPPPGTTVAPSPATTTLPQR